MRAIVISALLLLNVSTTFADGESRDGRYKNHDRADVQPLVFDAQGKFVGPLDDYGDQGVYLTISGAATFVYIERAIVSGDGGPQTIYSGTEFKWSSTNAADYSSSDCSGTPIITLTGGVRPSLAIRRGAEVTLYVAPATNSGPMRVASTQSGPDFHCAPSGVPTTEYGWPTENTYSVTGAYPEPLTIRYPRVRTGQQ